MAKLEDMTPQKRKEFFQKALVTMFVALAMLAIMIIGCTSCNVTRTVTTKAEYYQKGDTTIQIVTRTTESYDGKVDATKLLQK